MSGEWQEKLQTLERLIERERALAIDLQADALKALQEEKGALLVELRRLDPGCPEALKPLAGRLREDNRRNARLLYASLNLLRQTMNSCCSRIAPSCYGRRGHRIDGRAVGILHTGKV
ncbi:MAG: hypothetical protein JXR59_09805 [Desulfuromonadaceae bacterium]|nr:hypothetical protein [Desulfuromonadaceae bacterium]